MRKVVLLVMGICLISLGACQKKEAPAKVEEKPAMMMDEGARIFKEKCSACHGPEGRGDIGPDLTDNEWKYGGSDDDLFETISNGRPGGMPAWKNELSEEKIREVIKHIRSFKKD